MSSESTLIAETIKNLSVESPSSKEIVLSWLHVIDMPISYMTGGYDTKSFCDKIYAEFPEEFKVRQDKNPSKYKLFSTIDNGTTDCTKEQQQIARGMKAMYTWLKANIGSLEYTKEGPRFTRDGTFIKKKELEKVLSELAQLSESEYLTAEEHAVISKILNRVLHSTTL